MKKEQLKSNVVNLTLFRNYIEQWIENNKEVNTNLTFMVRQLQPTNTGLPIEVYFFLKNKEWKMYEHNLAEIMESIYAFAPEFGLEIYQRQ